MSKFPSKTVEARHLLSRRQVLQGAAALAAGIAAPTILRVGEAFAAYPERPVKIIVANTPGGPSDIIARIMAAAMQEAMGGSVFVENRGGAGGNIGMGAAARSEPDGYTLLLTTSAYSVNPSLYPNLPYDPFNDFVPVCELAVSPHVFAVQPGLGVKTMKEFVALAKANPDKFNISTPPIGTTPQLQAEVLKLREGLQKVSVVVYKGGGDALNALLTGTVQLSSGVLAPAHPHIKAGKIVGLAVTGAKRWHDLPDIPTMEEAGYKDFVFETYTAIMAPAKTPPDVVAKLEKTALDVLAKPEMRERLTKAGFEVTAKPGKEHMARVQKEVPMFKQIVTDAGIKLQ
ncbi:MAG TPA: tripartite tricarboxylate transporter substrate-binding protein [Xanthobacteraceae bacterium]|nr:tripartite tricarboxylate transporter substrate-binding protein [Xanthobacteraceae bacterium]